MTSMGKRITFEEVQTFCEKHNIQLLTKEEEYVDASATLNFICSCGRNSNLSFSKLKISKGFCPDCRYERCNTKLRLNIEDVKQEFLKHDCDLLSKEYINSNQKLDFICSCGRIDRKTFPRFKKVPRCLECSIKKGFIVKESYENICNYFKNFGCNIITPKNQYQNKRSKLEVFCSCGQIFHITAFDFYQGKHHCNKCTFKLQTERLTVSYEDVSQFIKSNNCELITQKEFYKNSKTLIEVKCACGNIFKTRFILFKHENKRQCNYCGIATRSGEFAPRWNGGITPETEKIRRSQDYIDWRKQVFTKDSYTCQCCGDNKGGNLQAHHLLNFAEYPELRLDVSNGITLCENCHNFAIYGSFHHIYGAHNNTPEQLYEYIERYKSGEFDELKNKATAL